MARKYYSFRGGWLRYYRIRKLMTQEDLGRAARVSVDTVVRIENGRSTPQLMTISKLAEALEIHPDNLIEYE